MQSHRRSFLKQFGLGVAGLSLSFPFSPNLSYGGVFSRGRMRLSTPEAQGVSSQGILDYLEAIRASTHEFHSIMIARHGQVIAQGWWNPYRPEYPQMLYSLSKSFTSTAVGLAVAEGKLKVTDKVVSFFPDKLPQEVSPNLAALSVKDLLTMSVGHAEDSTGTLWGKEDWVRQFLSLPIPNPPGTKFLYNSGATYMLSAIVQKLTGQKILDYLRPRLFQPLGIEDATWETCPRGINTGGWGLKLRTEALARFAQLYLQKGIVWNGKQIIPAAWVEEATSFKIQQPVARPGKGQAAKRLAPGLLLPVLALPAQRLPRRRRVWPIRHRFAGPGRGGGDHQRELEHARSDEPRLGPLAPRHENRGFATGTRSAAKAQRATRQSRTAAAHRPSSARTT